MAAAAEEFNTLAFEKRLTLLKDSQESIQALSSWCLSKREYHKKIVACWLNVLKRAKVEHRLVLFYLANDVIQYSKRKNYEFVESWGTTLQKATPLVRDDKVKRKILRIFRIWEQRQIYDDEFLTDLTGLLSVTAGKQTPDLDPNDFQVVHLVNKIRQCSVLEVDSNQSMKHIKECHLPLNDIESLTSVLKERKDTDEAKRELDNGIARLEAYVTALQKELVARTTLCRILQKAHHHYYTQRGEVKVVVTAYKSFGSRVRGLKRKLDELCMTLPSMISPVPSPPSPGEAVPSPGPDEDIDLPFSSMQDISDTSLNDNSLPTHMNESDFSIKGFGSFLGNPEFSFSSFKNKFAKADNSTSEEGKKIEVINTRPGAESSLDIHSLINSLIPSKPQSISNNRDTVYRPRLTPPPPPPPILPGLDLLNRSDDSDGNMSLSHPSNSNLNFYGSNSLNSSLINASGVNTSAESYSRDSGPPISQWNWDMQRILPADTPESPPIEQLTSPKPPAIIPVPPPTPDVDQRQLLAPPPSMPQVLLSGDDVDQRMLPPLPPVMSPQANAGIRSGHKGDVDHRNLISLTMGSLLPPPAPPISPWTPQVPETDLSYRNVNEEFSTLVPPPMPPHLSQPPPIRRALSHNDNVESIDMEMSDEEIHDDDDYSRHMRIESSMAQIHGHPPPPIPHHNQQLFRNQDANRDKSFTNNNRLLVDVTSSNMHHDGDNVSRTNLVRLNSSEEIDNMSEKEYGNNSFHNEKIDSDQNLGSDIFTDFPTNAMNPSNPNIHNMRDVSQDMKHMNERRIDEEWDRSDDEVNRDPWQNRAALMNPMTPMTPNFPRINRPMLNQRPQMINFRRPPPLLNQQPFIEEPYFVPQHNMRGKNNYRRPWGGHQRPPRGGYW